jgi:type IV secretory pathway TraG/TraD family ATPase VirD4
MAGSYYEKNISTTENNGTSRSTSFQEKPILRPEDLNCLDEDAVLLITNHGFVKVHREAAAYYKAEPFKSKYEKIIAVNKDAMADL